MIDALGDPIHGRGGLPHLPGTIADSHQKYRWQPIPVENLRSEQQHRNRDAASDAEGRNQVNPAELRKNTAAATVQQI